MHKSHTCETPQECLHIHWQLPVAMHGYAFALQARASQVHALQVLEVLRDQLHGACWGGMEGHACTLAAMHEYTFLRCERVCVGGGGV